MPAVLSGVTAVPTSAVAVLVAPATHMSSARLLSSDEFPFEFADVQPLYLLLPVAELLVLPFPRRSLPWP